MTEINGLMWPDDVGTKWQHSLAHVKASLEVSLSRCKAQKRTRTAVQAGGNIGLWPRRMADVFKTVITFEPDDVSFECLKANVPETVLAVKAALGEVPGVCGMSHKSLGSHKVTEGHTTVVTTVDALSLDDLDLLQLDVEGSEGAALRGAEQTLARCKPVLHIELRDLNPLEPTVAVVAWLKARGYQQVATAQGSDVIFEAAR
jgi:FkbM family methyltransferase